ncbi:MAG: DUF5698 domain-containing protein [bacterium]
MLLTCIQIFLARVVDVTLGTLRTIQIVRGKKKSAAIVAFFEVFIWFMIAKEALDNVDETLLVPIFYSLGFAVGTYIGVKLTSRFINSYVTAQITTKRNNEKLITALRDSGFGVSVVSLKNSRDQVKKDLLFISINKRTIDELTILVRKFDEHAFILFNETRIVQNGLIK